MAAPAPDRGSEVPKDDTGAKSAALSTEVVDAGTRTARAAMPAPTARRDEPGDALARRPARNNVAVGPSPCRRTNAPGAPSSPPVVSRSACSPLRSSCLALGDPSVGRERRQEAAAGVSAAAGPDCDEPPVVTNARLNAEVGVSGNAGTLPNGGSSPGAPLRRTAFETCTGTGGGGRKRLHQDACCSIWFLLGCVGLSRQDGDARQRRTQTLRPHSQDERGAKLNRGARMGAHDPQRWEGAAEGAGPG